MQTSNEENKRKYNPALLKKLKEVQFMRKRTEHHQRKIVRINGVKIVNSENSKKSQDVNPEIATEGTTNLIWLADKDNLEL